MITETGAEMLRDIYGIECAKPCKTCDGSGYVSVPVCCGRRSFHGDCCGDADHHQDRCPDCTATT